MVVIKCLFLLKVVQSPFLLQREWPHRALPYPFIYIYAKKTLREFIKPLVNFNNDSTEPYYCFCLEFKCLLSRYLSPTLSAPIRLSSILSETPCFSHLGQILNPQISLVEKLQLLPRLSGTMLTFFPLVSLPDQFSLKGTVGQNFNF